jgi:predicted phage tail protein
MKITTLLRTPGILSVALALTAVSVQAPVMADMVGTPALAMQAELQMQRDDVRTFMARDDVRHAMLGYGVSAADVDARINNMTESELLQIQHQMDMLPAGANGAVGLVLGVILIFVLLDLLGATDVFPGI